MEIKFDKSTRLSQLQADFGKRFNYLKIEFFKLKSGPQDSYKATDILKNTLNIGEVSSKVNMDTFHIDGLMRAGEVERKFSEKLGINVQIFRKSGKVWLITSSSDGLTLDELNAQAREKEEIKKEEKDENDYHEQE